MADPSFGGIAELDGVSMGRVAAFSCTLQAGMGFYRVRKACARGEFATIAQALAQWRADKSTLAPPHSAVIDIADSSVYLESLQLELGAGEHLLLRSASLARPSIHLPACDEGLPIVQVHAGSGSGLTLDGLSFAGKIKVVSSASADHPASLALNGCTLIPHTQLDSPAWRAPASLLVHGANLEVNITRSVLGPIQVEEGAQPGVKVRLRLSESIVDGGHASALAISNQRQGVAAVNLSLERGTVIGVTQVSAIGQVNGASFLGPLLVALRHSGKVNACYLAPGSRTPCVEHRVHERPQYISLCYGMPGYGQVAARTTCGCADGDQALKQWWRSLMPRRASTAIG
ncbi:MAG: hypothetical protein ACJ8GW_14565 [Massilia sp.]